MATRTLAFQVSEELLQRIKTFLARYEQIYHRKLSQKEFWYISLKENWMKRKRTTKELRPSKLRRKTLMSTPANQMTPKWR